jgi:hypothetical protein
MSTAYEEYQQMCAELDYIRNKNLELQADNNRLREALEKYEDLINYQYTGSSEAISALQDASNHAEQILAKTPAQIRALKGKQNES